MIQGAAMFLIFVYGMAIAGAVMLVAGIFYLPVLLFDLLIWATRGVIR